jgi:hypothetical protein
LFDTKINMDLVEVVFPTDAHIMLPWWIYQWRDLQSSSMVYTFVSPDWESIIFSPSESQNFRPPRDWPTDVDCLNDVWLKFPGNDRLLHNRINTVVIPVLLLLSHLSQKSRAVMLRFLIGSSPLITPHIYR